LDAYFTDMSAKELIEQIKKLPPEERRKLVEYFRQDDEMALHDAPAAVSEVKYIPKDVFEASRKRVFEEHRDLLARLAK
jgi:hypothetical protein